MNQETGILFISHGSPRKESNQEFINLTKKLALTTDQVIEPAFLECATPTIEEGFDSLVHKGKSKITVLPYFLGNGKHTMTDIPKIIEIKKLEFPHIEVKLQKPIGTHPSMIDYLNQLIKS